ncbi:MAG: arylamine N-acetyltransferase, partial [Nannocystaceae bacterium]
MSLPILPDSTRDAYLRRLEIETPSLDLDGLTVLQGAHLRRVPFHNLGLLINDGKPYRVPSLVEVAQANTRGIGGTCHLTTPGFATLLRTLGFEVDLIGGAVTHPGD